MISQRWRNAASACESSTFSGQIGHLSMLLGKPYLRLHGSLGATLHGGKNTVGSRLFFFFLIFSTAKTEPALRGDAHRLEGTSRPSTSWYTVHGREHHPGQCSKTMVAKPAAARTGAFPCFSSVYLLDEAEQGNPTGLGSWNHLG